MRATILRAWPGCTRSSRVDDVNSVRGYFVPACTFWYGEQFVVALHVEQRRLAHDRTEQVRALDEHHAHQQAAVRAAHDAEVRRRRDLARDQVLRDRDEVVVRVLA